MAKTKDRGKVLVQAWTDPKLADELKEVADEVFDGNVAMALRFAIRGLVLDRERVREQLQVRNDWSLQEVSAA